MSVSEIGRARRRTEDPKLLRGDGRFSDDFRAHQQTALSVVFVRSPHAHAAIRSIEVSAARALPGVRSVLLSADLPALQPLPVLVPPFLTAQVVPRPVLASGRVRMVGEPVVMVVADSPVIAADAAALVEVEYEPLDAVVGPERALESGAPRLHDAAPDNIACRHVKRAGDVDAALAEADHVIELRVQHGRVAALAIEPRGILVVPDNASGDLTVYLSTQTPWGSRDGLARVLGLNPEKVRVIAPDVGGAFGSKSGVYPEDVAVTFAAQSLGRPVSWMSTRSEDLIATMQGRDMVTRVTAGADASGRILGLRARTTMNLGAYAAGSALVPLPRLLFNATGAYDIQHLESEVVAVFTNTTPTGPYRGAGRPEAAFLIERVADEVARALGLDPVEVRRRNFIPPEAFPYVTAGGESMDSGEYARALDRALEVSDYRRLRWEQNERRSRGEIVGIGIASYIEWAGSLWETGAVHVDSDGGIVVDTGSSSHGQGHETAFAQIASERLGIPFEQITVRHGDTSLLPQGIGTYGSRSAMLGGSAVSLAASKLRDRLFDLAADALEVSVDDLEIVRQSNGGSGIGPRGLPGRSIALRDLVTRSSEPLKEDVRFGQQDGETFPFGSAIAMVSIDPETGKVSLERFVLVDDCGTVINPLIVQGQLHGGIMQGLGEALLEEVRYDESGQSMTGSLLDYAIPRASTLPASLVLDHTVTPSPRNPLGVKGVGESGTVGTPVAIANAVVDALSTMGVHHLDVPIRSETVWRLLQDARATP